MSFETVAKDFLAQKNIAVVGASATDEKTGNAIYRTLRDKGYTLFAIHPQAETIEGDRAYASVKDVPQPLDGVFIVARPEVAEAVMKDCVDANVPRVWMHHNALFGAAASSVSEAAVAYGRENGITVIDGGCPMMFFDFFHKCMRGILGMTGKLPKPHQPAAS